MDGDMNEYMPAGSDAETLRGDLLVGAKAIADYLETFTAKQIYRIAEKPERTMPIWKEPGVGVVSSKMALAQWRAAKVRERTQAAA